MDVSRTKMYLDTSILEASKMNQRKYQLIASSFVVLNSIIVACFYLSVESFDVALNTLLYDVVMYQILGHDVLNSI
jgi:hypothetical protein